MIWYSITIDNDTFHAIELLAKVYKTTTNELTKDILRAYVADNHDTIEEMEGEI